MSFIQFNNNIINQNSNNSNDNQLNNEYNENNENKELNEKIIAGLKNLIRESQNKLNNLENENENLKKENIKLKNENNNLFLKLKNLNQETTNNNKDININSNNNSDKIIELLTEKLEIKEKEIKELKKTIEYNSNNLMTVIFNSKDQIIHYSLICKKTDQFSLIEKKLYEAYPEYQESEILFFANGEKIKRFKTLEENKITNSQVIALTPYDCE